jgi:hypothetical protein
VRSTLITAFAVLAIVLSPSTSFAQPRGFISVNGGFRATSSDFADSIVITRYVEQGSIDSSYFVDRGPQLDIAGGARLWRSLGGGVGVTRFSRSGPASVIARIPHPFFFNQLRQIEGEAEGLTHKELGVHLQVMAMLPVGQRLSVVVFGGPSFFRITRGLVDDVQYDDQYPYDSATFTAAGTSDTSATKLGFNAGADVGYFFARNVGVGGVIRFSGATVNLDASNGNTVAVDAGGFQAGAGLRLRF